MCYAILSSTGKSLSIVPGHKSVAYEPFFIDERQYDIRQISIAEVPSMKRKLTILLVIALALVLFMNACQTGSPSDDGASTGKGPMTAVTDPETGETIGEAPELNLDVTQEEAEEGWLAHGDIGFKYQLPKAWVERLDYLDPYAEGDPSDVKADLYRCLYYDFMETALIERAQEIINDATLTNEEKYEKMSKDVWSNAIKIFGVQLFRREAFNKAESLEKLTKFPHNRVFAVGGDVVHIVSWANEEAGQNLPEKDWAIFAELIESVDELVKSVKVAKPVSSVQSLDAIRNWTFNTVDLDGQPVDQSIFAEAKLTMVNIWATWCNPCRVEIPDIAALAKNEFAELDIQVLGIVTDVEVDEDHEMELALAKQILDEAGASYLNVKFNKNMNDSLFKFVQAFPTTVFMDSNGNVVGAEIVGARSKDAFLKEAEARLAMLGD